MKCTLVMDDGEWQIVLKLLQREREELRSEIHHTDNRKFKHELQAKLDLVDSMLARMPEQVGVCEQPSTD